MSKFRVFGVACVAVVVIGTTAWQANSHCQIPCGIYDDNARLTAIAEHTRTIDKAMAQITEITQAKEHNANQLVRWVNAKEVHADKISEIVTQYFMTQRIKPADASDAKAHGQYVTKLTLLHRMLVAAMKCKQTTDVQYPKQLRGLLAEFTQAYGAKVHTH